MGFNGFHAYFLKYFTFNHEKWPHFWFFEKIWKTHFYLLSIMYIEVIKVLPNVDFYSKFSWDFNQRYLVEETKLVSHPTVFPKVLFLFFFTWTEIPTSGHPFGKKIGFCWLIKIDAHISKKSYKSLCSGNDGTLHF